MPAELMSVSPAIFILSALFSSLFFYLFQEFGPNGLTCLWRLSILPGLSETFLLSPVAGQESARKNTLLYTSSWSLPLLCSARLCLPICQQNESIRSPFELI